MISTPPISVIFPYTTLFRSRLLLLWTRNLSRSPLCAGGAGLPRRCLATAQRREYALTAWGEKPSVQIASRDKRYGRLDCIPVRSEEHTSELQSRENLVCRLL